MIRKSSDLTGTGCAPSDRPEILDGPRDWLLQFASRSQGPIRIAQELARHDHCIRLFRPNDVLRLNWRSDHSDRAGHDFGFAADTLGKGHLVTGADRNFRVGHVTTGRTIDEIDSHLLQLPGEFDRLIDIPPAIDPIRRRDAQE